MTKMRSKCIIPGLGKTYKEDFPYLRVSFYTRVAAIEACFGDPDIEEANLAYSICQSFMKVSSLGVNALIKVITEMCVLITKSIDGA